MLLFLIQSWDTCFRYCGIYFRKFSKVIYPLNSLYWNFFSFPLHFISLYFLCDILFHNRTEFTHVIYSNFHCKCNIKNNENTEPHVTPSSFSIPFLLWQCSFPCIQGCLLSWFSLVMLSVNCPKLIGTIYNLEKCSFLLELFILNLWFSTCVFFLRTHYFMFFLKTCIFLETYAVDKPKNNLSFNRLYWVALMQNLGLNVEMNCPQSFFRFSWNFSEGIGCTVGTFMRTFIPAGCINFKIIRLKIYVFCWSLLLRNDIQNLIHN